MPLTKNALKTIPKHTFYNLTSDFRFFRDYISLTESQQEIVDELYLKFVAKQPCVVTGGFPVQVHHIRSHEYLAGAGKKALDIFTLPLVPDCHNSENKSIHALGNEKFEETHNISIRREMQLLQDKFVKDLKRRIE